MSIGDTSVRGVSGQRDILGRTAEGSLSARRVLGRVLAGSPLRVLRPHRMRTYVRALGQPDSRGRGAAPAARLPRAGRRPPLRRARRRWTPASTRSAPSRPSTACRSARACRSAGRSTRTGDAPMLAPIACGATRPILMADGRTQPLADLRVGDAIVGTERAAATAATSTTEVLDHWSTVKPAFRVDAGGRHRADHQRRPSLPDQPRLEARDRRGAGPDAAAAPDAEQRAAGHGRLRVPPGCDATTGAAISAG